MNTLEKRKLNLLVHLAHADGKFEKSEKELLLHPEGETLQLSDFTNANDKIELLYWALRMIQADKIVHEKEVMFCKHRTRTQVRRVSGETADMASKNKLHALQPSEVPVKAGLCNSNQRNTNIHSCRFYELNYPRRVGVYHSL